MNHTRLRAVDELPLCVREVNARDFDAGALGLDVPSDRELEVPRRGARIASLGHDVGRDDLVRFRPRLQRREGMFLTHFITTATTMPPRMTHVTQMTVSEYHTGCCGNNVRRRNAGRVTTKSRILFQLRTGKLGRGYARCGTLIGYE